MACSIIYGDKRLLQGDTRRAGLSLLFPTGTRPTVQDIVRLFETSAASGLAARISHIPQSEQGWVEILASGLTFDLRGLAPGQPASPAQGDEPRFRYGFEGALDADELEAIELVPSGHIAAGAGLLPVLRTMAGLAANLALHLPVAAVAWHSAQTLMEPRYFSRIVLNWLSGGAFPALGLTALVPAGDGSIASSGLAHFTGQEMQLEGRADEPQADTVKLAIRLIDYLVREGRLDAPHTIEAGDTTLLAEPSQVGRLVLVWRTP